MASNIASPSQSGHAKRPSFSAFPIGNAAILLEKNRTGIRRSTPDSDALASSDDEQDLHYQTHTPVNPSGPRSMRRTSWLNEMHNAPQRKSSLTGIGPFPPSPAIPVTPNGDQSLWNSGMGPPTASAGSRGHSSSTSYPWSHNIWTNESQRGPPSRLAEVLQSPTSKVSAGSARLQSNDSLNTTTISREHQVESAIPFAIPLHPTPKTYRSQSYSVGQLDPDQYLTNPVDPGGHQPPKRSRTGASHSGAQMRPSRPSLRGEIPRDGSFLGQVEEVEDGEGSYSDSENGVQLAETQARTIEQLAMENAILRANQLEDTRDRDSLSKNGHTVKVHAYPRGSRDNRYGSGANDLQESNVKDKNEDAASNKISLDQNDIRRTSSEYGTDMDTQYHATGTPENRKLESVKKGQWQSSLGFGGIGDPPQSRRHSFADVVPRHGLMISPAISHASLTGIDRGQSVVDEQGSSGGYGEGLTRLAQGDTSEYAHFRLSHSLEEEALELEHLRARNFAASYFSGINMFQHRGELYPRSTSPTNIRQAYSIQNHNGRSQAGPRPNLLLYVVTFKCCRGEIFYVQENTGLQIKLGDLVIVEADRGSDLGTVAHERVSWSKARALKEHYGMEHYRWLMMFSRHGQDGSSTSLGVSGQSGAIGGSQMGALGGMVPSGQQGAQEASSNELKPKTIKRLAQSHEVQTLRDKEGNEAKAKRVCQQKVIEHGLNMEILDAEFQVDWKKLTFYYLADSYINFNSLVTDLFKIYKTRIWMSAVNPASFLTAPSDLQLPSALGPGALSTDSDHTLGRRRQKENVGFVTLGHSPLSTGQLDQVWDSAGAARLRQNPSYHATYPQSFNPQVLEDRRQPLNRTDYGLHQQFSTQSTISPATPQAMDRYHFGHLPSTRNAHGNQQTHADWISNSIQGLSITP